MGFSEFFDGGYTFRPKGFVNRLGLFSTDFRSRPNNELLSRTTSVGAGLDAGFNSFMRVELNNDDILVGTKLLHRFRPRLNIEVRPGAVFNDIILDSYFGDEVDYDNAREGKGATINTQAILRPTEHLELRFLANRRWIDETVNGRSGRLFTAQVERVRAQYAFNSRMFVRLIGQYVETRRDPSMYTFGVTAKDATFTTSALFAYKLNWQTVLFVGYGDSQAFLDSTERLEKNGRQFFIKVSYAWQH